MNVAEIIAKTHRLTHTDTNTYTDANILADLNQLQKEMTIAILKLQGYREAFATEAYLNLVSTTGLTVGQVGYNGEYPFPDDFLKLKRIEVKYSGNQSIPTVLYDYSANSNSEYEDSGDSFTEDEPNVRFERGSFFIRPLPDTTVSGGIHIWYEQRQDVLVAGSTPALQEDFHRIYPLLLAKEYAQENPEKYNQLWDTEIFEIKREMATYYRKKFPYTKTFSTQSTSYK